MKQKKNTIRLSTSDVTLNIIFGVIITAIVVVITYPLIYVLSSSFSSGAAVSSGRVIFFPVDFSLVGYRIVFSYKAVWSGYLNTIIYTFGGTVINLILTTLTAYILSRRNLQGRKIYTVFFLIPMFFSGGIIPNYILMSSLHLTNTRWSILLANALIIYYMIIMRTFFQNSIPAELLEAAQIDGIDDVGYLFRIVIPLSKPVFAVISLYYAVWHWNSYFESMLYLRSRTLSPLQIVLRDILNVSNIDLSQITDPEILAQLMGAADVMKYSLIVIATAPILVAYPFVQRFFEKGVMIGALKG